MDPNTGEILGIASRPDYNPNNYQKYNVEVLNRNLPVWSSYEPGSTFKIVTTATAVEEGVVDLDKDTFYDVTSKVSKMNNNMIVIWLDFEEGIDKLNRVFGVVSYSPATSTYANYEDIDETLSQYTKDLMAEGILDENTKFAIKCRRVGTHDFTSQEMAAHCGGVVRDVVLAPVDLTNPDLTIFVEIRDDDAYIYHEKIKGPGGLPLGTQGKVVVLLSSGIDSPVAEYLMMKRGCEVIALHCNNDPFSGPKVTELFNQLVDQLNLYAKGVPIKKRVIDYVIEKLSEIVNRLREMSPYWETFVKGGENYGTQKSKNREKKGI